jgi:hypothetical protein
MIFFSVSGVYSPRHYRPILERSRRFEDPIEENSLSLTDPLLDPKKASYLVPEKSGFIQPNPVPEANGQIQSNNLVLEKTSLIPAINVVPEKSGFIQTNIVPEKNSLSLSNNLSPEKSSLIQTNSLVPENKVLCLIEKNIKLIPDGLDSVNLAQNDSKEEVEFQQ